MIRPKISSIYLDMDGVIADFEKRYSEIFDISPKLTRNEKEFKGYFDKFIANNEFMNFLFQDIIL